MSRPRHSRPDCHRPRRCVRRLASAAAVLCLLVSPGCFVFDELDNAGKSGAKSAPREAEAKSGVSGREKLQAYYNRRPRRQVEENPDDPIVRCLTGGSVQFMRKQQCELRGGRIRS